MFDLWICITQSYNVVRCFIIKIFGWYKDSQSSSMVWMSISFASLLDPAVVCMQHKNLSPYAVHLCSTEVNTRSHLSALFALIHSFHSQWESENCDLLSIFNVLSIHPFASAFHFQVLFNLLITLLNLLVLQETVFFCSSLCSSSSPALLLLKQHVIITGQRSLPAGVCVTTWQSICDQPEISCWLCTCSNIYSMFEVGVIVQSYCWRHTGKILGARRGQRSPSMRYLPITQL